LLYEKRILNGEEIVVIFKPEGVARIGIEPWRGIVIRLMDKLERVEQFCRSGELAIKSEGMEDTFKDIAVYSTLAMILFRKQQDDATQELTEPD